MGAIYVQGTYVNTGANVASHLNLIYQISPGQFYIIGARPLVGLGESFPWLEQGPIIFQSNWRGETLRTQAEMIDQETGMNHYFNTDGSVKNAVQIDLGGVDKFDTTGSSHQNSVFEARPVAGV